MKSERSRGQLMITIQKKIEIEKHKTLRTQPQNDQFVGTKTRKFQRKKMKSKTSTIEVQITIIPKLTKKSLNSSSQKHSKRNSQNAHKTEISQEKKCKF